MQAYFCIHKPPDGSLENVSTHEEPGQTNDLSSDFVDDPTINNDISEEEKKVHFQFFNGNKICTPERYVKIRNGILRIWNNSKPNPIKQFECRIKLNAIIRIDCKVLGKVFRYLESQKLINDSPLIRQSEAFATNNIRSRRIVKKPDYLLSEIRGLLIPVDNKKKLKHIKRSD